MNKSIYNILNTINSNGYEAYIVGGYVRDFLLGKKSCDIDICTNMKPDILTKKFNNIIEYNDFGGVVILDKKYRIEITTFRKELEYKKRKPIKIEYVNILKEDIIRRDFTINTICMNKDGNIIDLCDGKRDLNHKIIKSIGNPQNKFIEDPLRMLRAIRFATILDFDIEEDTFNAIKKCSKYIKTLSTERIREELDIILINKNYQKGLNYLHDSNIFNELGFSWNNITYTDNILGLYSQFNKLPKLFTKGEEDSISRLKEILLSNKIDNFALFNNGLELCLIAGKILGKSKKNIINNYDKLPIKTMSDIKIDGLEIMKILNIEPSRKISDIIFDIKKQILCGKINNHKKEIKDYILRKWKYEQK